MQKQGKGQDHIYSPVQFSSAQEHSDICLQFCIWDDCFSLSITVHIINRLVLDEIYPPLEIRIWFIINFVLLARWYHSNFPRASLGFLLWVWASYPRVIRVRAEKQTQIWIIAMPYTFVNLNRMIIPWAIHNFQDVKCRSTT